MARHNEVGKWGEEAACDYLVQRGCAIMARNWRSGHYELDIVAQRGDRVIFVEVKTRKDDHDGALMAFDSGKQRRMVRSANAFVTAFDLPLEIQYDLIIITGTEHEYKIEHQEDLYLSIYRRMT